MSEEQKAYFGALAQLHVLCNLEALSEDFDLQVRLCDKLREEWEKALT